MDRLKVKKVFYLIGLLAIVLLIAGCDTELGHSDDDDHDHDGDGFQDHGAEDHDEDEESHDYSVEIEGRELKTLSVQEVADLWGIPSDGLLLNIIQGFNLTGNYTVDSVLDEIREEYKFSPVLIKDIAEDIKLLGE